MKLDKMMAYKSILHQAADFPSKRLQFHWKTKVRNEEEDEDGVKQNRGEAEDDSSPDQEQPAKNNPSAVDSNKKLNQESSSAAGTTSKLKSVLSSIGKNRLSSVTSVLMNQLAGGGRRRRLLVGTLFGPRRGAHVQFAFQKDPTSEPVFLVELATPISSLVREMASGQVRVALECERKKAAERGRVIDEEGVWMAYLNGKKCGLGNSRRECGEREWEVLKCVEAISTGAGVLPPIIGGGEVMYMRAKFERVVGCRDSEALYMMNPADSHAPAELSLYILRRDNGSSLIN
ncbi:unnamed protein product [Cuscuta europaea]|uniref:Protein MIZU-KUSSEI 1 n=1 Tax=Cuscuta europaea TaxID=41803 RepID=A0A9P0Z686_CUSEU|nr:unnamed protein product [Cuscuta europaea]